MQRFYIAILGAALLLGSTAGCATPRYSTFEEAMRSCRMAQTRRIQRQPTFPTVHPRIAACLERNGWTTDGKRL